MLTDKCDGHVYPSANNEVPCLNRHLKNTVLLVCGDIALYVHCFCYCIYTFRFFTHTLSLAQVTANLCGSSYKNNDQNNFNT
jgi:hypothetical protein